MNHRPHESKDLVPSAKTQRGEPGIGYSTNLSVPTPAEEQQNHRTGEAVHRVQPAKEPTESAARRAPV